MNNQRGEIVTGVMVVMMVGMMIFGMVSMHGGHGDRHEHQDAVQKQGHDDKGHQHLHEGQSIDEKAPLSAPEENK